MTTTTLPAVIVTTTTSQCRPHPPKPIVKPDDATSSNNVTDNTAGAIVTVCTDPAERPANAGVATAGHGVAAITSLDAALVTLPTAPTTTLSGVGARVGV